MGFYQAIPNYFTHLNYIVLSFVKSVRKGYYVATHPPVANRFSRVGRGRAVKRMLVPWRQDARHSLSDGLRGSVWLAGWSAVMARRLRVPAQIGLIVTDFGLVHDLYCMMLCPFTLLGCLNK